MADVQQTVEAAARIQDWWRETTGPRRPKDEAHAARIIQTAWRRFSNRQVYKFYKDLIAFRERGDPGAVLRGINPLEAKLMDVSAGTHVRFRLAGATFPPTVVYKIFCHFPVIDLGAFGPRDYASERATRQQGAGEWYSRKENNGWRPVAASLLDGNELASAKQVEAADEAGKEFHHVRLVRRQDAERRKKEKRRDWLRRMYAQQATSADGGDADSTSTHSLGPATRADVWDDTEIDDLVGWAQALDFDQYYDDWIRIATTGRSDDPVQPVQIHDQAEL